MAECLAMNMVGVGEHSHNFPSIVVKIGLRESHQWILNGVGGVGESQGMCVVSKCFSVNKENCLQSVEMVENTRGSCPIQVGITWRRQVDTTHLQRVKLWRGSQGHVGGALAYHISNMSTGKYQTNQWSLPSELTVPSP